MQKSMFLFMFWMKLFGWGKNRYLKAHLLINFSNFKALYRSTMIFVVMHLFFICHSLRFFLDIREFWKIIAADHSALTSEKKCNLGSTILLKKNSNRVTAIKSPAEGKTILKSQLLLLGTDRIIREIKWGYLPPLWNSKMLNFHLHKRKKNSHCTLFPMFRALCMYRFYMWWEIKLFGYLFNLHI